MKKLAIGLLVTSVVSLSSFASTLANPNSGGLIAGRINSSVLVTISGTPAKKIHSLLTIRGNIVRLATGKVVSLKHGNDITCIVNDGENIAECKVLIGSHGDADQLTNYITQARSVKEGFATIGETGGVADLVLNGQAAVEVAQALTAAKSTSRRTGSLLTTETRGLAIACTTTAEVAFSSTCQFSVNSNGDLNSNLRYNY